MKKIFIILLSILTFYACSDDNKLSIEDKEQEVFDDLIGKWQLSRYSNTPDFKVEPNGGFTEDEKKGYLEFTTDSVFTCHYWGDHELDSYSDNFKIKYEEDQVYIECEEGLTITGGFGFRGNIDIYSISKDILILQHKFQYNSYFEYKRIK